MPTTSPLGPISRPAIAHGQALIRSLNPAFASIWERAGDQGQHYLAAMHQHHTSEMERAKATGADPMSLVAGLHVAVDHSVRETLKETPHKIQCKKGCAHCCHIHITVAEGEALLMAASIREHRIPIDRKRLAVQAAHASVEAWRTMDPKDRRCVFLGAQDECRIYPVRPMQCRKYMVTSKPKHCDTIRHMGDQVAIVAAIEAEAIADVAMDALQWGSFPVMLAKALEEAEALP